MFNCKVCLEKDKRLQDANTQIVYLQRLVDHLTNRTYPKAVDLEADKILNGANTFVSDMDKEEVKELNAVEQQAYKMLTGQY